MALLEIVNLNKSYKKKKVIVDLSFELQSGEIMGLIGQNGSGKTTIFKAILGLVKKDSGKIKINEVLIEGESKQYLNHIGSIIEYPMFYETLTARQNLQLIASLYDISLSQKEILESLRRVGLENSANSKVSNFSLGMKQRLGLAQALVHHPTICC
nr:ABC transporter ATP-binding protein [Streptococcus gallolyticus]